MRVALAQIDPTVGDIDGNAAKIAEWIGRAREEGAELAIFPELCVPGYPAEDLYLKRHFVAANRRAVEELAARRRRDRRRWSASPSRPPAAATSATPTTRSPSSPTAPCAPSTARTGCPTTPSSTSSATSSPAPSRLTIEVGGTRVGLTICEDVWVAGPAGVEPRPTAGATLIANPSGSPYHRGKGREREAMFAERARAYGAYFAFCNLVGGQDELVFDGQSFVIDPDGDGDRPGRPVRGGAAGLRRPARRRRAGSPSRSPTSTRSTAALVLGLRDYVAQERLPPRRRRPLGRDRLGPGGAARRRRARPRATSAASSCPRPIPALKPRQDARTIAANLGCRADRDPDRGDDGRLRAGADRPTGDGAGDGEEPLPRDPTRPSEPDLAAENIQARIRGNLMMALSNQHGWLVLTTGNKSEMSVGYATLYGDMAGGFAVIKDVPKTLVYELVRHRNERGRARAGARLGARARALGRAAPRPARQRLAAALRAARPHPRGLRRARPGPRGDDRRRACPPRSSTR